MKRRPIRGGPESRTRFVDHSSCPVHPDDLEGWPPDEDEQDPLFTALNRIGFIQTHLKEAVTFNPRALREIRQRLVELRELPPHKALMARWYLR